MLNTHQVKLEGNYVSVFLAMMVIEGLGRSLDPEANILSEAWPVVVRTYPKFVIPELFRQKDATSKEKLA